MFALGVFFKPVGLEGAVVVVAAAEEEEAVVPGVTTDGLEKRSR